ncbi:MAG: hypothetical protein L7S64_03105 [Longimicrobiales bacterium]|nr:hypothetical protein [Longimicrobiales bacterium]
MSEPPPRYKQTFESFAGSFRFDPLEHAVRSRSEVTPTLPPARAAQVAQARQTERRDLSTRANDQIAPWIPANYSTPQGVLVAPVTFTQTTANTANVETALSQARFNTPPPELSAPPPPSPRSAHGDMSLDELATSAFASDALLEAVTGPTETTLVQIMRENEEIEVECKKRKLMNDKLQEQVQRTTEIYNDHKKICATMRAEVPVIQTQAQADLQKVRDVITEYDKSIKDLLFKKWRLDDTMRTEALPCAQAEDTAPTLKLEHLDLRPSSDQAFDFDPMTFRGFTNNEHLQTPSMSTSNPFESFDRMQAIRRVLHDFRTTDKDDRACPWCKKPIGSIVNLKNHVLSTKCPSFNKPTPEELAKL